MFVYRGSKTFKDFLLRGFFSLNFKLKLNYLSCRITLSLSSGCLWDLYLSFYFRNFFRKVSISIKKNWFIDDGYHYHHHYFEYRIFFFFASRKLIASIKKKFWNFSMGKTLFYILSHYLVSFCTWVDSNIPLKFSLCYKKLFAKLKYSFFRCFLSFFSCSSSSVTYYKTDNLLSLLCII